MPPPFPPTNSPAPGPRPPNDGPAPAGAAAPDLAHITAVIVTYNSAHCLPEIAQRLREWPHIIIADNASADGSAQRIAPLLPQARVLALSENLGFGAANNAALAQVRTPFALLMNPDCAVTAAAARALAHTAAQWPDAAIIAPQLTTASGQPQINYGWARRQWRSRGPGAHAPACVTNACAAAWLLRLDALPTREWFDTRFFLYYEDEDLCLRLSQAGHAIIIDPAVRVPHANRASVRGPRPLRVEWGRGYHHARSKILFVAKHLGQNAARRERRRALLGAAGLLLLRVFAPSPKHLARLWGRVRGLWNAPTSY